MSKESSSGLEEESSQREPLISRVERGDVHTPTTTSAAASSAAAAAATSPRPIVSLADMNLKALTPRSTTTTAAAAAAAAPTIVQSPIYQNNNDRKYSKNKLKWWCGGCKNACRRVVSLARHNPEAMLIIIAFLAWFLVGVLAICTTKLLLSTPIDGGGVPSPLLLTFQQMLLGSNMLRLGLKLRGNYQPWPKEKAVVGTTSTDKNERESSSSHHPIFNTSATTSPGIYRQRLGKALEGLDYLLLAGLFNGLDFLASNTSFSHSSATFVETIKASEPITTTALAIWWGIDRLGKMETLSLTLLITGVLMSTYANAMATSNNTATPTAEAVDEAPSLNDSVKTCLTVMTANLCFAFRAMSQKLLRSSSSGSADNFDDFNLLCRMQQTGAASLLVPVLMFQKYTLLRVLLERPSWQIWGYYVGLSLVNAWAFATYSLASCYILSRISVVQHSGFGCLRRMFAILATSVAFGVPISALGALGILLCVVGFSGFTHFRFQRQKQPTKIVRDDGDDRGKNDENASCANTILTLDAGGDPSICSTCDRDENGSSNEAANAPSVSPSPSSEEHATSSLSLASSRNGVQRKSNKNFGAQSVYSIATLCVLSLLVGTGPWTFCAAMETEVQMDGNGASYPSSPPVSVKKRVAELTEQAFSGKIPADQLGEVWMRILQMDKRNRSAMLNVGLLNLGSPDPAMQKQAIDFIARCFDEKYVDDPIPMPSPAGLRLAMMVARFRWEEKDSMEAYYYYQLSYRAIKLMPDEKSAEICVTSSLATLLHPFPSSVVHADEMYHLYMQSARSFLETYRKSPESLPSLNEQELAATVPGAAEDPYLHCILTMFHLSFYYRADVAEAARLHYEVATAVWPRLNYASPHVLLPLVPPHLDTQKPCTTRKIQLGIASGFLTPGSSVAADFGGVMQRLDRDIFNVTYIHFSAKEPYTDPFVYRHPDKDRLLLFRQESAKGDVANATWMARFFSSIEALNLDVLLYLDLTMSPFADRMSMARLAPVQANSHGHPVTSGIATVDYYISWGAAELDYAIANTHYTEELILLNPAVPHQYYTPRNNDTHSIMNGQRIKGDKAQRSDFRMFMKPKGLLGDAIFDDSGDENNSIRWYTCMQKPHKFMPEMDPLLCNVLREDPGSILLLHKPDVSPKMQHSFEERLKVAACDMERIYFIPALPHHMLLDLYKVSTLILDSYPAGGCTTTREALELSKVVVTLPARLLGGRWSYAYYQMLNDEILNEHVIADSPEDYVRKAVRLGRNDSLRNELEGRIRGSLHNLYESDDAVRSWETVLSTIAPIEKRDQCS